MGPAYLARKTCARLQSFFAPSDPGLDTIILMRSSTVSVTPISAPKDCTLKPAATINWTPVGSEAAAVEAEALPFFTMATAREREASNQGAVGGDKGCWCARATDENNNEQ